MADAKTNRTKETFEFSNSTRGNLRRLKKIYGTKKNVIETAVSLLNQNHQERKAGTQ